MLQNFMRLADGIDVTPLLDAINSKPGLWGEIIARQTTPGTPHRQTEAIFLRWCEDKSVEAALNRRGRRQ